MTVATCEALFGPRNPIRDEQLVEDVWQVILQNLPDDEDAILLSRNHRTFETGLAELFLSFFPTATLRETQRARERLQDALAKYCEAVTDNDE